MTCAFDVSFNQVSSLQQRNEELESEIQSLQEDLIVSHKAYEQCKKELDERKSDSDYQTDTFNLHFDVKELRQQTNTLDIDAKPHK